jgi:hypothetical protein
MSISWKRVFQVGFGFGFWSGISWVFDNILYPAVIAWKGLLLGGLIMSVSAIIITAVLLVFYEYTKVDWMGMEELHALKEKGADWMQQFNQKKSANTLLFWCKRVVFFVPALFFRGVLWMLNRGDGFAFVALSITTDPFLTAIYLRHGRFDGLNARDWGIFLASGILSNVYWTLRSFGVVMLIRFILEKFSIVL